MTKESVRESIRKWKRNNPDKVMEYARKYKDKNRLKLNEYARRYYQRNPDVVKKNNDKRLSSVDGIIYKRLYQRWRMSRYSNLAGYKFSAGKQLRLALMASLNDGCKHCGQFRTELRNLTIDHINSKPCDNTIDNLQWLCWPCHKKKSIATSYGRKEILEVNVMEQSDLSSYLTSR